MKAAEGDGQAVAPCCDLFARCTLLQPPYATLSCRHCASVPQPAPTHHQHPRPVYNTLRPLACTAWLWPAAGTTGGIAG